MQEPLGVMVPPSVWTVDGNVGRSWKSAIPRLRDFFASKVKVAVVGVAGGEEGRACWAKLKLGVEGRMIASTARQTSVMYVRIARFAPS